MSMPTPKPKTCCECGMAILPGVEPVLIEFGWAHPACIAQQSDWSPRSW